MEQEIKVLVTGARGFIGKNLIQQLLSRKKYKVYECDVDTTPAELQIFCEDCQFVFHLAGVNRPEKIEEFMEGNFGFTTVLIECLKKNNNKSPILMSSSIQAVSDNEYGKSKKKGEDYIINYGKERKVNIYIFRLPNVFGKWCRPNYNSVVATFCNNIAAGLPIAISNREVKLNLVYIDDVVDTFISAIVGDVLTDSEGYCVVPLFDIVKLGDIVDMLENFKESRKKLTVCNMQHGFEKKLYSTYLSYLPEDAFFYDLKMNSDERGSFTEFLRSDTQGQVSVNVTKPHVIKGNHWHDTKNEKFLVISGEGLIRFRKIGEKKIIEYRVSGKTFQVLDVPCGFTHSIENIGETDMITIMWVNECYDKNNPDTYFEEV